MHMWCLRLGLLCCVIIRAVHGITNETINEIPDSYAKIAAGNSLWRNLLHDCRKPSMSCVQKNVYEYLDSSLEYPRDIEVTDFLKFSKNDVNFSESARRKDDDDTYEETERSSPIEEVTGALHNKVVKFMMTHDLEVKLPETFFEGVTLKVSPRSMEEDGALVKIDLVPRDVTDVGEGRILFKKIKKFISDKLLMALLAVILIVKLIAVKVLFFLPMIMGVAAAKKLFLKVILFVFPFLSHLFKLCPYYGPTKYHHHNHHISHVHHLPSLHHGVELDHPPPSYGHAHEHTFDYYSEGPGVGDYHRKNFDSKSSKPAGENDVAWSSGQGQQSGSKRGTKIAPASNRPLTPTEIENMILKAEQEATLKARLQEEQKRVEIENKRLQDQIKQALKLQEKLKLQSIIVKQNSKIAAANVLHNANMIPASVLQAPHIVHAIPASSIQQAAYLQPPMVQQLSHPVYQPPPVQAPLYQTTPAPTFDSFYSPILEKIDKVFLDLGYNEEACRERLVCSMYKNPAKFSPHSNLISVELSRDSSELQKPTSSNTAVIRFYRYVQAARDGQDKRDCIRLYPACAINTEL